MTRNVLLPPRAPSNFEGTEDLILLRRSRNVCRFPIISEALFSVSSFFLGVLGGRLFHDLPGDTSVALR